MDLEEPRAGERGTPELETLRERIRVLEQILDALPDLVCAQGRDGRFLYANRAFCEFHGRAPAEIIGSADDGLRLAMTAEAHAERRGQVISSGIFVDIPSERLSRPSGTSLLYNILWCPLRNTAGEVEAIVVRAHGLRGDEDEQATAAQAATHTKALLSIIPDMYFRLDRDGTYIDFSAGRGLDTALPPSLFLGKRVQDVTPDVAPWAMAAAEEALRTSDVQTIEYKMFVQGAYVDYEARILPSGPAEVLVLVRDISKQKKIEEERARLQDEMMRIQEAMMVELSTPLIPISDDILVMPLIGAVDARRAQHIMERLLHGVTSSRAKVVILDVTGMSSVTTETASALVRCAQAMRLLGARALLTGVRPDVAQTLVSMGVDLAGIVTLSTLKAGIAYAMGNARARAPGPRY